MTNTNTARGAAAQPAGAQQPGTAYAALPAIQSIVDDVLRIKGGAENWGGWSATPDVCDLIVTKLQAVSTKWALRNADYEAVVKQCAALATSHGQAPAQAAPAAVAGPHVTDAMALAFHSALSDGAIGSDEVEEIKAGLRAALAAAPTTQPAPQQEAQEPAFWTVCAQYEGGGETGWIPLPGYSNETEHGVKALVLQAARKEGYKGTATGRLMELSWEIRPVYLASWAAAQPSPASQEGK